MCQHHPPCPGPDDPGREAAHTLFSHPEQGWSLLCNGVVLFEDSGELLPDGRVVAPRRPIPRPSPPPPPQRPSPQRSGTAA